MEKKVAGLLGVVGGALAAALPASAMTAQTALHADSYADLLKPVPDAVAVRDAINEARIDDPAIEEVQYYVPGRYYHHHHHHHRFFRRRFFHHHHHHHHGPALIIRP